MPRAIRESSLQLPKRMERGPSTRQLHSSMRVTSPVVTLYSPRRREGRVSVVRAPSSRKRAEPCPRQAWASGMPTSGRVSSRNCSREREDLWGGCGDMAYLVPTGKNRAHRRNEAAWERPNAPKLKRGGHEGKRAVAGASAAPDTQLCARKMAGPLSLAAHLLGARGTTTRKTVQDLAYEAGPTRRREHPGPLLPGRKVPHMLRMSALQVCHPMLLRVLMKAYDPAGDR